MGFQVHSEPEFAIVPATGSAESTAYPGAFFPHASSFEIHGGVFTSNIYNHPTAGPREHTSGFRTILLGDIKLLREFKEMSLCESAVVSRQPRGAVVRRVYSAEIRRDPGPVTVIMYQGDGAEEEWRQLLAKYEAIRHPKIMQLYGLVSTRGLRAMVFHDELIPYCQYLYRFQHSTILNVYIRAYCSTEFHEATNYVSSVSCKPQTQIDYDWLLWIRPITGELCMELVPSTKRDVEFQDPESSPVLRLQNISLDDADAEAVVISSLAADKYHELCLMPVMAQCRMFSASNQLTWEGPAIFRSDPNQRTLFRITKALHLEQEPKLRWQNGFRKGEVLPNSWMRYDSCQACHIHLELLTWPWRESSKFWVAQANHIFAQLPRTSNFQDYVFLDMVSFVLRCLPNPSNTREPEGYLFVCPPKSFRIGANSFQWPSYPAYWSLDPSGAVRLSAADAKILGFPIIHIETRMSGYSWRSRTYEGLRRFHTGKGFDPESQDVARYLDYPLFEVLSEQATPLAYHEREDWPWACSLDDPILCRKLGHYL